MSLLVTSTCPRVVWLVFYMLGMTTLLPWNFFIAVNDYWNFKVGKVYDEPRHRMLQVGGLVD